MSKFDDIIREMKRLGDEHPFPQDFTARTMERLAAIRPFAAPAEQVPAPRPIWRRWRLSVSAAAVVLAAVAVWEVAHAQCQQTRVGEIPIGNAVSETFSSASDTMTMRRVNGSVSDITMPNISPSCTGNVDSLAPANPTTPQAEPVVPNKKTRYAADPSFVQPDQRQAPK